MLEALRPAFDVHDAVAAQASATPAPAPGLRDAEGGVRPPAAHPRVRRLRAVMAVCIAAFFFLVIPALNQAGVVPDYKLNFLGKYLCFAIVALGIDLIWGYTGLLSLCQALFFCLGGYAMAMHLSLPQGGGVYAVPQFLSYVYYGQDNPLPPFWRPMQSFAFAVAAGIFVPALVASVFGFLIFRSRVRGVYFSIITQAVAWGAWLLISRHEMLLGGTNGLTNFSKSLTQEKKSILGLYLLTVATLAGAYLLCRWIARSRLGRVLVAVRDKETRLYFAGYKPYAFQVFAFTVAAVLAAVGGMLYSPQVTIISPHNMRVEESILMVIWVALGGRGRLWGGIIGSLLVNYTYAALTSDLPAVWPFVQGAMFLAVVLLFPGGLVSLWDGVERAVESGAGWARAVIAAAPMAVLVLFVAGEALGMTPEALRTVVFRVEQLGGVQLKYVLFVAAVAAVGGLYFVTGRRQDASEVRAEDTGEDVAQGVAAPGGGAA